jgi:hypothetical protein
MIKPLLILLLSTLPAWAAVTVSLEPVADAYLSSASASQNFGNAGALVLSGSATPTRQFQSILRFDLATVKAAFDTSYGAGNWSLSGLSLKLTAVTPNNVNFNPNTAGNLSLQWLTTDTWTESGITWNGLPGVVSGGTESLGTAAYDGSLGSYTFTLTPSSGFLADALAGKSASILLSAADPATSLVVNSRNFSTVGNRPSLTLTATPEPSRLVLLGLGLTALLGQRRRLHPRSLCTGSSTSP